MAGITPEREIRTVTGSDREASQVWKDGTRNSTRTQGKGE